ncbi:hypothetical protein PVAP13_7KG343870, partial [Panicum virgatum]
TEPSCGLADLQAACFVDPALRAPARHRQVVCAVPQAAGGRWRPGGRHDPARAPPNFSARGSRAQPVRRRLRWSTGGQAGLDWVRAAHRPRRHRACKGGFFLYSAPAGAPPEIQSRRGAAYSAAGTCRAARGWAARNRNGKVASAAAASRAP